MQYSRIELPMTNILEKAYLNQHPFFLFRALHKYTDVIPNVIEDLSKEFDYQTANTDSNAEFMSGIQEFVLSELHTATENDSDKFHKFLETIIPKTKLLIQFATKYMRDKVSFIDIIKYMEPFMIYSDSITYKQHDEIRRFINGKIKDLVREFGVRREMFRKIRNFEYRINKKPNVLLRLLSENKEFAEDFFETYKISKDGLGTSSTEILASMIEIDSGNLYNNMITSILLPLITPSNLADALSSPSIDDMGDLERIKATDCTKRYLSKKYASLGELQKDNNIEDIYYDEAFDDTPYDIMNKYKSEQKKMTPDVFLPFLAENLKQRHDCPEYMADSLAATLIAKKKRVVDGEYAILEIKPKLPADVDQELLTEKEVAAIERESDIRKKIQYYRRVKNNWVRDNDISDEAFLDTNALFCNVDEKCYKNTNNGVCESTSETDQRMKHIMKKRISAEFDKRYSVSVDELTETLKKNIAFYMKMVEKTKRLRMVQLYKANNLAFTLGSMANVEELISSPHSKLLNMISSQDDFTKKQHDICLFFDKYCRNPMVQEMGEDEHWSYCKETNTKLLPFSIYELAKAFVEGADYMATLSRICRTVGIMSDDGDAIVDKHSGFVLRKIDFSNEEGFDEAGFQISTHDILEKDLGDVVLEVIGKKEKRIFETELSEMIYNIFTTICSNIHIPMSGMDEFVMRVSNELIDTNIMSETKYAKRVEASKKKDGPPMAPYSVYRDELRILFVASVLLIAIQTATPSHKTSKTFPGCLRSFSGYPLDGGVEDMTGVKYIACVLNKLKTPASPWTAIRTLNVTTITNRMKAVIDKYINSRSDITELYVNKRNFLLLTPDIKIPDEHSILKWQRFLPPVVPFEILKTLRNVASDFHSELLDLLRKGHKDQDKHYFTYKSKVIQYGYGIIESINNVVKTKDQLLKTSARIPFVENACCNDLLGITNPITYFKGEDENLLLMINAVRHMSEVLASVKRLGMLSFFNHIEFTGIRYPAIPAGQLEETIYQAIIHYCNFDKQLPVPEEYQVIITEKPVDYKSSWSIEEKMEFLKKSGKRFDIVKLNQLMMLVRNKNLVVIDKKDPIQPVRQMNDMLDELDRENSTVMEEILRDHLHKIIERFDPRKMIRADSTNLDPIKNYLISTNGLLLDNILEFFERYGNLSNRDLRKYGSFLTDIQKWNERAADSMFTGAQFIKNAVRAMSAFYPTMLVNDTKPYTKIHAHWGLSDYHMADLSKILKGYYSGLEPFQKDTTLTRLLMEVSNRLINLGLFMETIPVQKQLDKHVMVDDIQQDVSFYHLFDKDTIELLFVYCFYSVIYEYIQCSDDPDLLANDVQEIKNVRRGEIVREKDKSSSKYIQSMADADEASDLFEVEIQMGNKIAFKTRVCSLLLGFLDIEMQAKTAIDFSYENITERVNRSKNKEKKTFTDYLKNMTIDQRKVEQDFKTYKLGRWNVGEQKGVFVYDQGHYDMEREQLIAQLSETRVSGGEYDVVDQAVMDIYELDKLDERRAEEEGDMEAFDIGGLGEDYTDGDYYGEDDRDEYE